MKICLTVDADWALKEVKDYAYDFFLEKEVPFTYFVTKEQEIDENDLVEIAWHPNFKTNNVLEELSGFEKLFPGCKGLRPHGLKNMNLTVDLLENFKLKWVSWNFSKGNHKPEHIGGKIINFSVNWGDYSWFSRNLQLDWKRLEKETEGFYTAIFHPIHVFLNTECPERYLAAKKDYHNLSKLFTMQNNSHYGVRDILLDILALKEKKNVTFLTLSQAYESVWADIGKASTGNS